MTPEEKKAYEKKLKEYKKLIQEAMKKQEKIKKAFNKACEHLAVAQKKWYKAIDKCKFCKETKFRKFLCKKHREELERMLKESTEIELSFRIKANLDKLREQGF